METLAVSGRMYALLADDHYGTIQVINVTDPTGPVPVTGIWDGSGSIGTFNTSNKTYVLVVSESTIQVINVTDPADPSTISGTRAPDSFHFGPGGPGGLGIFTESGRTYAMAPPTYNQEIQIINITDVLAPDLLDPVEIDSFRFLPVFTDSLGMGIFSEHGRAYALVVDYGSGSGGGQHPGDRHHRPRRPAAGDHPRRRPDGFDAMDNPLDVETFSIGGVAYALVSNPGGSVLQLISLSGQAAP